MWRPTKRKSTDANAVATGPPNTLGRSVIEPVVVWNDERQVVPPGAATTRIMLSPAAFVMPGMVIWLLYVPLLTALVLESAPSMRYWTWSQIRSPPQINPLTTAVAIVFRAV